MEDREAFLKQLGNNIRKHRESKKLNQEKFAKSIKIARRHYGEIERGKVNPSIVNLLKISLALNITVNDLVPSNYSLNYFIGEEA